MSDLEALTIDRSPPSARARRGAGLGPWIALALLGALVVEGLVANRTAA